jgi:hypothetical protein
MAYDQIEEIRGVLAKEMASLNTKLSQQMHVTMNSRESPKTLSPSSCLLSDLTANFERTLIGVVVVDHVSPRSQNTGLTIQGGFPVIVDQWSRIERGTFELLGSHVEHRIYVSASATSTAKEGCCTRE